jgi:hypothetical protein
MGLEDERLRELDHLIRAAHAEVGTLQFLLINAHERGINPAELGMHIANLGRQISLWECERRLFQRCIAESVQPVTDAPHHGESVRKSPRDRTVAPSRRAPSLEKSKSRQQTPEHLLGLLCV